MTDDENAAVHTVRVPDWLKHCFDDVYDTDAECPKEELKTYLIAKRRRQQND